MGSRLVARLIERSANGEFELISGGMLLAEFAETVRKPRIFGRVNWEAYNLLVSYLSSDAVLVTVEPPFPACRDANDEYLLAMARDGAADFLVTNDQDLLSVSQIGTCRIVTPEEFTLQFAR